MGKELQSAIDCLKISDVYLKSSNVKILDAFEPKYEADVESLNVQFKHVVTSSRILKLENDQAEPGESSLSLFLVFIAFGTRWVESTESKEIDEENIKAEIEGIMVAEYQMQSDPGKEALEQFAMKNASYHIWPYWREYLSSMCTRMNLPKITLPTVQFAQNQASETD